MGAPRTHLQTLPESGKSDSDPSQGSEGMPRSTPRNRRARDKVSTSHGHLGRPGGGSCGGRAGRQRRRLARGRGRGGRGRGGRSGRRSTGCRGAPLCL
eukprot:538337-Rhodomonas_salina.2